MTANAPASETTSTTAVGLSGRQWQRRIATWRPLQNGMLLVLLGVLAWDRWLLCKEFLFKYTDEDQAIMWLAAHEFLHGNFHEPCFFGQDYNSCVEGYLAAPLIAAHMPYHIAVPLVTVVLGLMPFLLIAWSAWWRRQTLVAGAALLVPIILPVRYAMMTGMPRGFVTGLAFASIPLVLLMPAGRRISQALSSDPELVEQQRRRRSRLTRRWPAVRYFVTAAVALLAIQLNPNCLVVLVPAAVLALITSWREWKFWVFGTAGLLVAAPYLLYAYQFYYQYHTDYPVYLRGRIFTWSYVNFESFLWNEVAPRGGGGSPILMDLVPLHVSPQQAPLFIMAAFAGILIVLLFRLRVAAVFASLAGAAFIFITFAYDRVNDGRGGNTVSFPFGRMYLALPVFLTWMLFLVNYDRRPSWLRLPVGFSTWATRGVLVGMALAGFAAMREKAVTLPAITEREFQDSRICVLVPVGQLYATASEVQRAADAHNATVLVVGNPTQKYLAYALPCLTTVDTLFPQMERRTWRIIEEERPGLQENALLVGIGGGMPVAGGQLVERYDEENPGPAPAAEMLPAGRGGRGGRGGNAGFGGGRGGMGRGRNTDAIPVISVLPLRVGADGKAMSLNEMLRGIGVGVPGVYEEEGKLLVRRNNWMR